MELYEFFEQYISTQRRLEDLAERCKCHVYYLQRIAKGAIKPGPELAINIEVATGGLVTRRELRPDIWGDERKILAAARERGARRFPTKRRKAEEPAPTP